MQLRSNKTRSRGTSATARLRRRDNKTSLGNRPCLTPTRRAARFPDPRRAPSPAACCATGLSPTWRGRAIPARARSRARPSKAGFSTHGPLFWPYAYADFVDYTFYPYAYDTFWPYAYDDFYDGMFGDYSRRGSGASAARSGYARDSGGSRSVEADLCSG